MKQWHLFLLATLLFACNSNKDKTPGSSADQPAAKKEAIPAAVTLLYKSVAHYPDSMGLRLKLVDALDSTGSYRPALAQLDSLIIKDSLNFGLWYRKAQVQEHIKDTSGALKSYHYAARIYASPDALLAMANLYAEQKDKRALQLCQQVATLRLGREYTAHHSFISGIYYARTGRSQKAIDYFNHCIANDYTYMEAYMEKGFVYYDDKKITEALDIFKTAATVKNTYADAYYWQAKCYETLNNKPEAIKNYQASLMLDPNIPEAIAALKKLGVN